jgi:hypothetical protein
VEDVVQAADSDDEGNGDWEDCDSDDEIDDQNGAGQQ